MPSLVTHYLLGHAAINDTKNHLGDIIKFNQAEFDIGTSGPDIFFYYHSLPWKNQFTGRKVANFGSQIHLHDIDAFFKDVFINVRQSMNHAEISYVAGLLCHWAMDKTCHPYIFYRTNGHEKSHDYHREFESTLDALMLMHLTKKTVEDFKPYEILRYTSKTVDAIYNVYHFPLKDVYNFDLKHHVVKEAMKDFYTAQKHLYDPNGGKKAFFANLENKFKAMPFLVSSMIVQNHHQDDLDIMNNDKKTWYHPSTNQPFNDSFIELFYKSMAVAKDVLNIFNDYLMDNSKLEDLLAFIDNQSFETGLSTYQEMTYSDCIYKN